MCGEIGDVIRGTPDARHKKSHVRLFVSLGLSRATAVSMCGGDFGVRIGVRINGARFGGGLKGAGGWGALFGPG